MLNSPRPGILSAIERIIQNQSSQQRDLDIDSDSLDEQKELKKAKTKRYRSDTFDRKWLAIWTAVVVSLWLGGVFYILCCNNDRICLSDSVMNVLLGTTTLNVLGLSFIVLRGHFNSSQENE